MTKKKFNPTHVIDFETVKTIKDIKGILKAFNIVLDMSYPETKDIKHLLKKK